MQLVHRNLVFDIVHLLYSAAFSDALGGDHAKQLLQSSRLSVLQYLNIGLKSQHNHERPQMQLLPPHRVEVVNHQITENLGLLEIRAKT